MPESRPDPAFVAVNATEKKSFLRRGAIAPRRRKRGRVVRVVLAAIVVSAAAVGLSRFFGGSQFALQRIEVSGNRRARTEEILRAVEPWRSSNLVGLDLSAIARAIRTHPWIDRVTLSKRLPDGLSIRVMEKKAVALYRDASGLSWLSSDGHPIASYDPRADSTEYVLVSGDLRALP
ncbi:MAG TPA: FtsQ-type POTRA domain-containing protein, partial [Thermoanaerobaculia bacterium]|nr:FtsQ-type POTRA domain-containing protein [Thermoanaerobaculia bacterium]